MRVRPEGSSGACKPRGRAWAWPGLSPGFLGPAALRLPCPREAWPRTCALSMGREDREGRGLLGQDNVRQGGLGHWPGCPSTRTWQGCGGGLCTSVCLCVTPHPHGASVLPLILPVSCPSWKKANALAWSPRERNRIPLNPGAADEGYWGYCVSGDLNQEHRDVPKVQAIRPRIPDLKMHHRWASGGLRGASAEIVSKIA